VALIPRSDRQETGVRLRYYFHRPQRLAPTDQIDPAYQTLVERLQLVFQSGIA